MAWGKQNSKRALKIDDYKLSSFEIGASMYAMRVTTYLLGHSDH
jgi:hypothetical protein